MSDAKEGSATDQWYFWVVGNKDWDDAPRKSEPYPMVPGTQFVDKDFGTPFQSTRRSWSKVREFMKAEPETIDVDGECTSAYFLRFWLIPRRLRWPEASLSSPFLDVMTAS